MQEKVFVKKALAIWTDICVKVYLFDENKLNKEEISKDFEFAFKHTKFNPLGIAIFYADPNNLTNQIGRGQKAIIKRWNKWIKQQSIKRLRTK